MALCDEPSEPTIVDLPVRKSNSCKKLRRDISGLLDEIKSDIYNSRNRNVLFSIKETLEKAKSCLQEDIPVENGLTLRPPDSPKKKNGSTKLKRAKQLGPLPTKKPYKKVQRGWCFFLVC